MPDPELRDPEPPGYDSQPLRVSTLELFFDLVFVFTITQLTGILSRDLTAAGALRVLLIFGVLWWMYGGYAWLTNARTPALLPERLLLLLGMVGFLVIGLTWSAAAEIALLVVIVAAAIAAAQPRGRSPRERDPAWGPAEGTGGGDPVSRGFRGSPPG